MDDLRSLKKYTAFRLDGRQVTVTVPTESRLLKPLRPVTAKGFKGARPNVTEEAARIERKLPAGVNPYNFQLRPTRRIIPTFRWLRRGRTSIGRFSAAAQGEAA